MGMSTHVLDQINGQPAPGLRVTLSKDGVILSDLLTNDDGRCGDLLNGHKIEPSMYEINFYAGKYLKTQSHIDEEAFFDVITVRVNITDLERHYHIPLLLSAYGYSTYRGS